MRWRMLKIQISILKQKMSYIFKLYDENGILVYERKGITDISAQRIIPILKKQCKQKTEFQRERLLNSHHYQTG